MPSPLSTSQRRTWMRTHETRSSMYRPCARTLDLTSARWYMYAGYNASKQLSGYSFVPMYAANLCLYRTCNNQANASIIQILTASDFQQYPEGTSYSQQLSQTRKAEKQKQHCSEPIRAAWPRNKSPMSSIAINDLPPFFLALISLAVTLYVIIALNLTF